MIKFLIMILFSCVMFVGCNKHDMTYISEGQQAQGKYEAAFVNKFGEPASDQTWGFGTIATTRSVLKPDMPAWYDNYEQPTDITNKEYNKVLKAFSVVVNNPQEYKKLPTWKNFIVQHVHKANYSMDQLQIAGVHANDFNATYGGKVMYKNEKLGDFSYWNSHDGQKYNDWICLEVDGALYVGFDYKQLNNDKINPDGVYNDWIIKISEAKKKLVKGDKRIIAEDLSVNDDSDWDFNDVVFDVKIEWNRTIIILQAAGGTIPLYIGDKEVHELFGVPTTTMVNTGDGLTLDPVQFELEGNFNWNYNNIPVRVKKGTDLVELIAPVGKAASKIAVDIDYRWVKEHKDISNAYKQFDKYVQGIGHPNWWKHITDENLLY